MDLPMTDPCEDALQVLYHFLDGELTAHRVDGNGAARGGAGVGAVHRVLTNEIDDFEVELRQVIICRVQDRVPDSLRLRIAAQLMDSEED